MEQSQLVELIRTLQTEEKEQILHFATNQFFNQGRMRAQVIPLLDIFLNQPWHISEQKLDKRDVFTTIFPNQTFLEGKIEKVMVEAHKVVKAFLLVNRYFRTENEFHQLADFSEEVRARGLDTRYDKTIARLQKMQEEAPKNGQKYYQRQFLLEYSKYEEETVRNQGKGDLNIPNTLQALELNYYLNRLLLLNQFLLQQKIAHLEVPLNTKLLIEDNQIPADYLDKSIAIRINYEIFLLLRKHIFQNFE